MGFVGFPFDVVDVVFDVGHGFSVEVGDVDFLVEFGVVEGAVFAGGDFLGVAALGEVLGVVFGFGG